MKKAMIAVVSMISLYACNNGNSAESRKEKEYEQKKADTTRVVATYLLGFDKDGSTQPVEMIGWVITKDTLAEKVIDSTGETTISKKVWSRDTVLMAPIGVDTLKDDKGPVYKDGVVQMVPRIGAIHKSRIYEILFPQ